MQRIIKLLIVPLFLLLMVGCSKEVCTEHKNVEVVIVDSHHEDSYVTYTYVDGNFMPIVWAEKNEIIVEYNGNKYVVKGQAVYYKYMDKIGETVAGTLEIKKHDDGTEKYSIVSLN